MSNFKTVRCTGGKGVPGSRGVVGDELSFFTCEPNRLGTMIRMISEKERRKNRKGWKGEKKERKRDGKNGKDEKMQKSINNNKHHRHGFLLARASTRFTFCAVPLIPLPRHQARSKGATTQPRHQTQDRPMAWNAWNVWNVVPTSSKNMRRQVAHPTPSSFAPPHTSHMLQCYKC